MVLPRKSYWKIPGKPVFFRLHVEVHSGPQPDLCAFNCCDQMQNQCAVRMREIRILPAVLLDVARADYGADEVSSKVTLLNDRLSNAGEAGSWIVHEEPLSM